MQAWKGSSEEPFGAIWKDTLQDKKPDSPSLTDKT